MISGNVEMLKLSLKKNSKLEANKFQQDWNGGVHLLPSPEFLITFTDPTADQNFPRRKQTEMFLEQYGAQQTREFWSRSL